MRLAVVALVLAVAAGCSAPDPGAIVYGSLRDGGSSIANGPGSGGTQGGSSSAGTTTGGTTGGGTTGGGTTGGSTAADSGSAAPLNAFSAAPSYAKTAPGDQSTAHHNGASNAGVDCLSCHVTGSVSPPGFMFAGTVYTDSTATTPAVNAEIRVISAAGAEIGKVYSDDSGNFWLADADKLPTGTLTGARNGATPKVMSTPVLGACNSCHAKGGTTLPMSVK